MGLARGLSAAFTVAGHVDGAGGRGADDASRADATGGAPSEREFGRCRVRPDPTVGPVHGVQCRHGRLVQRKVEDVRIGEDAVGIGRFRNYHQPLLQVPADDDLRGRAADPRCDRGDGRIVQKAAAAQRAPALCDDAEAFVHRPKRPLLQPRVQFDLVDRRDHAGRVDDPVEVADLAFRADVLSTLIDIFKERQWSQADIARALEIPQPRVSEMMRGKVHLFSSDRLIGYLAKAGFRFRPAFDGSRVVCAVEPVMAA